MADISLRDYLDKLDSLTGTPDEVIHHCRHILQYFPKNVATYRYLGRALLSSAGLEEAGEVFRRVLAVYPDDVAAHVSLSEVYQRTGKPNEALHHMERAFEQEPNNKTLIDNLRELYRKYRQEDFAKLQLTTGAVARQYTRNGLYSQAIDTLRTALERSPNRHDLRLLLARTLWDSDLKIEAAEQALDVLKALPDCLDANRLMTQLWLEEGRPSDAQRYLSHIEAVDPYVALQIAQEGPVPDNAFRLPEADYGSVQRRRLETAQPDWLSEIGQADWTDAPITTSDVAASTTEDELLSTSVPDDWLAEDGPALDDLFADGEVPSTGLTGMLAALDQPQAQEVEITAEEEPSFDFNFDDEETPPVSDELPDWLNEAAPVLPDIQQPTEPEIETLDWLQDDALLDEPQASFEEITVTPIPTENDPLAWMQGTDIEMVEAATPSFFDDVEEPMAYQNPEETDPLAWLQGTDVEVVDESSDGEDDTPDNPLAWLQGAEIELDDEEPASEIENLPTDWLHAPDSLEAEPTQTDSLSWLQDDSILDEALDLEQLTYEQPLSISNLLEDTDAEPVDTAARYGQTDLFPGQQPTEAYTPDGRSDMNDQELPDWMKAQSSDDSDADSESDGFSWLNEQLPTQPEDDDQALDWMMDVEEEDQPPLASSNPDWLIEEPETVEPITPNVPDWLKTDAEEPAANSFEWLIEEDEPTPQAAATLDWLSEEPEEESTPVTPAEMPDWLSSATPATPETATETGFDWLAEQTEDEPLEEASGFEWIAEETEAEPQAADVPDWLTAAAPSSSEPVVAEPAAIETGFDWLSEQAEDKPLEADVPDWLTAPTTAETTTEESGFDWLSEQPEEEAPASAPSGFEWLSAEEDAPQLATTAAVPDWLGATAPVTADQDEEPMAASSEFEWIAEQTEDEPHPAADVPDWLTAASPMAIEQEEAVGASTEFGWLAEDTEEELEEIEPTAAVDIPDWMATSQPISEPEAEEAFSWAPDTSSEPSWLSELAAAEEDDEQQPTAAEVDWLGEPVEDNEHEERQPIETLDWGVMDEATSDEFALQEEVEPVGDMPDWLSSMQPETEGMASEAAWEEDNLTLEGENSFDEDERLLATASAPPPASNAPDWLNAMVPGLDLDYEATEVDQQVEREFATPAATAQPSGFDWLVRIVEEETGPIKTIRDTVQAVRRRFTFQRQPAWLREPMETSGQPLPTSEAQSAAEDDDDTDFDLPDWLK